MKETKGIKIKYIDIEGFRNERERKREIEKSEIEGDCER